jgi:prolyl-tRNA synthetase
MQRYSKLFGKTIKNSKEYNSHNATLLIRAGFVKHEMAGVYSLLPLGLKVLKKIENIIREEMDKVANEVFMPVLQPVENWNQTNRFDSFDVLFKAIGANENSRKLNSQEYAIGASAEEMVTPLAKSQNQSYKDFPFSIYQFQNKFRNEARPKSGLLRGREFIMKDSYSFHTSHKDMLEYYEVMKKVYTRIFERAGLGDITVEAIASGGAFSDENSHEYQTITDVGEDTLFKDPKSGVIYNQEVTPSKAPLFDTSKEQEKDIQEVEGKGIIGVEELAKFLKIEVERTTKTLLFEADSGKRVIAAALRGDYDINTEKFGKVIGSTDFQLASEKTVEKITGAKVGYAGLLNLPKEVEVYMDDSMQERKNFEMGANKTDYHTINVNFGRDLKLPDQFYDFKLAKKGDICPESGEKYEIMSAVEVGNIFPLNTKYSDAFDYKFIDKSGKLQPVYMGCYGIGLQRTMGVIAEVFSDEKGLCWPDTVAPFDVHFITLDKDHDKQAQDLIKQIEGLGKQVLWDDRENTSAGEKFVDADLIGIPVRLILSDKRTKQGGVEITHRKTKESKVVSVDELVQGGF